MLELWKQADTTPSLTDHLEELARLVKDCGDLQLKGELRSGHFGAGPIVVRGRPLADWLPWTTS